MPRFDYDGLAEEVANQTKLDRWRAKLAQDPMTKRWADVFDKVEPSKELRPITGKLIGATNGTISSDFLYAMVLAAWSYGFAAACNGLADEEFMLFSGPLEGFPDMDDPAVYPQVGERETFEDLEGRPLLPWEEREQC